MPLSISHTDYQYEINKSPSRFEIHKQNARLEHRTRPINLNTNIELPTIEIDQSECFATSGLMGPSDLARDIAARGKQNVLEQIGRIVDEGYMLAAIERGGNPIAQIARANTFTEHKFGMVTMPAARPKFTVKGGVSFDPEPTMGQGFTNNVETRFYPGQLDVNYTPSKLQFYVKQYASVNIEFTPAQVDVRV